METRRLFIKLDPIAEQYVSGLEAENATLRQQVQEAKVKALEEAAAYLRSVISEAEAESSPAQKAIRLMLLGQAARIIALADPPATDS